jgi:DNA replication ATP-dependent helicase Dna2
MASEGHDPAMIRSAVDTVERFQGQERDVIIATFALGDPDMVSAEDGFLMSLNRFNVLASRARAKLVVLVSEEVIDHLPTDVETLRESRLLKEYAENACPDRRQISLPWISGGITEKTDASFRWLYARPGEGGRADGEAPPPPPPPPAVDARPGADSGSMAALSDDLFEFIAS